MSNIELKWFALTSPYVRVLAEKRRKVLPFGGITVYRPSFAQLGHGEPVEQLGLAAAKMRVDLGLRVSWGSHVELGVIGTSVDMLLLEKNRLGEIYRRRGRAGLFIPPSVCCWPEGNTAVLLNLMHS